MKTKLIALNWVCSLVGLCIDMDRSPLWAVILAVCWFASATLLLNHADRRGWMNEIFKIKKYL